MDQYKLFELLEVENFPEFIELFNTANENALFHIVNYFYVNKRPNTLLHMAAQHGNIEIAMLLISKGALLMGKNEDGNTAIDIARSKKHYLLASFLLSQTNPNSFIYLFTIDIASEDICFKLANFWLSENVMSNAPNTNKKKLEALLNKALTNNYFNLAHFLLLQGVNTDIDLTNMNINLKDLLHNALTHQYIYLINFLLSKGVRANIDITNMNINLENLLYNALTNQHLYLADFLLSRGVRTNIDITNMKNISLEELLYNALISKLYHFVDFLLFNVMTNADITNMKNISLEELLYNALTDSCFDLANLLLSRGISTNNINIKSININLEDLLYNALTNKHLYLADFLLSKGVSANIDITNMNINFAELLHNALQFKHNKLVLFLSSYHENLKITALTHSLMKEDFVLASSLISIEFDINHRYQNGNTLLHLALIKKNPIITKYLLEKKANIYISNAYMKNPFLMILEKEIIFNPEFEDIIKNFFIPEDKKNSYNIQPPLLYMALKDKKWQEAEILINYGSDVNAICEYHGNTLLHWASGSGHLDAAEFLIAHGANVNACNLSNETPLHLASKYGHDPIILLLIENNALIHMQNKNGKTPFELACSDKYFELSYLL